MSEPIEIVIDKDIQMILKSFKAINREIVFNTQETSVVHPEEKIIGLCTTFKMPCQFALTSLNRLLSALKWADTDKALIYENHIIVKNENGDTQKKEQKIHHHDNYKLIKHVDAGFADTLDEPDCTFDLTVNDIRDIKEANKNLDGGDNPIRFHLTDNTLNIVIGDNQPNALADMCKITREIEYDGPEIKLVYMPSDFVFIEGDYEVSAYENGIAVFKLKPLEVEDELVDYGLYYFLTTGIDS